MSNCVSGWRVEYFDSNKEWWVVNGFYLTSGEAIEEEEYLEEDYENVRVVECEAIFVDRKVRRMG